MCRTRSVFFIVKSLSDHPSRCESNTIIDNCVEESKYYGALLRFISTTCISMIYFKNSNLNISLKFVWHYMSIGQPPVGQPLGQPPVLNITVMKDQLVGFLYRKNITNCFTGKH